MTGFDYTIATVLLFSTLISIWRGLIRELIALAGWVAAFWVAVEYSDWFAAHLFYGVNNPTVRALVSFLVLFFVVLLIFGILAWLIAKFAHAIGLSWLDRGLGAFFGLARGLFICILMVLFGGMTSAPQTDWWQQAQLSQPFETAVMVIQPWLPTELAKRINYHRNSSSTA